jgi:hypothetical protein
MRRHLIALGALAAALCAMSVEVPAEPQDRLERFRALAALTLGALEAHGEDQAGADVAPLYALIDEEIVENLDSGGPFASPAFIQVQLDGFAEAWGAAALRVSATRGARDGAPLLVGSFNLGTLGRTGSLRVYGLGSAGVATVLAVSRRPGTPEVIDWPPTRRGEAQFMVRWVGEGSGRGPRALRLELWRRVGPDDVRVVWSTAERFPDGLWATAVEVKPGEVVLHYELRYPGWKPGCEEQTEQIDVFRYQPTADTLTLARSQPVNPWHRELGLAVARFFAALHSGDQRTLAELVPDPALRGRLPKQLEAEPACEGRSPERPGTVAVAAAEERASGVAPWSLWWTRGASGWRLAAADPVLH